MSDLSFKIRAEYAELDKLSAKLNEIEAKIESLDTPSGDFDGLNKQFAELVQQVEKKHALIDEMEANNATVIETEQIKSQSSAYDELGDSINNAIGGDYLTQLQAGYARLDEIAYKLSEVGDEVDRIYEGIGEGTSDFEGLERLEKQTQRLNYQYEKAVKHLDDLESSAEGLAHKAKIDEALAKTTSRVDELGVSVEGVKTPVKSSTQEFNSMEASITQLSRGLPMMSSGVGTFTRSLSYSLPRLATDIKKAKLEYNALIASGEKATPVWKQIVKSLFSVQTAMMAGIGLIIMYKDEIIDLFKKTSDAEKVNKEYIDSLKDSNNAYGNAIKSIAEVTAMMDNIDGKYVTTEKTLKLYNDRLGETLGYETDLNKARATMVAKKPAMVEALAMEAKAHATLSIMVSNASTAMALERNETITFWDKALGYWKTFAHMNTFGKAYSDFGDASREGGTMTEKLERERQLKAQKLRDKNIELIEQYQKDMADLFKFGKDNELNFGGVDPNDAKAVEKALDDIQKKIQEKKNSIGKMMFAMQLEIQQREINAMEEGTEKKLAQIDFDAKKEKRAISKKFAEIQKANAELAREQGDEDARGFLTEQQQEEYEKALQLAGEATIKAKADIKEKEIRADEQEWNEYVIKYGDYQEKRIALIQEWGAKIEEAKGVTAKASAKAQRDAEIGELDFKNFQESIDFADIFSNIDTKSTKAINVLRDKIAEYLKQAGKSLTPEQQKILSDVIIKMDESVKGRNPFKELTVGIRDYIKALRDGKKSSSEMNEMLLEIADTVGVVNATIDEYSGMLTPVLEAFGGGELAEDINSALDIVTGTAEVGGGVAKLFAGDLSGIKDVVGGLGKVVTSLIAINDRSKERSIQRLQDKIEVLDKSYASLADEIDKAYSMDASNLIKQNNELLAQQKALIRMQIAEEKSKKKTDKKRIKAWEDEMDAIDREMAENRERAKDAIFGADIQSAISDFANAYADAWASGEDKISSMKDVVKNMVKAMVVEMLQGDLKPTVEKIRDYLRTTFEGGGIIDFGHIDEMIREAENQNMSQFEGYDDWVKESKGQGSASKGVFGKIDQTTANALDGRFTDFQMSNREILEQSKSLNLGMSSIAQKMDMNNKILDVIRLHNEDIQVAVEEMAKAKEYGMAGILEDIKKGTDTLRAR